MITINGLEQAAARLAGGVVNEDGFFTELTRVSPLLAEFFLQFRGAENLPFQQRKDLFTGFLIDALGGNSSQVLNSADGVPGTEERARNQSIALEKELAKLVGPGDFDDTRSLAEINRDPEESLVFRFIERQTFPDLPLKSDPSGGSVLENLNTPIIGFTDEQLDSFPGLTGELVGLGQETFLSPFGAVTFGRGPALLAGLKVLNRLGVGGRVLRRLLSAGDSTKKLFVTNAAGRLSSEFVDQQGASPEAQIFAEAIGSLIGGKIFDDAVTRGIAETLLNPFEVDSALRGNPDDLINLIGGLGQATLLSDSERLRELINRGELDETEQEIAHEIVDLLDPGPGTGEFLLAGEDGPRSQEQIDAFAEFFARRPRVLGLTPHQQDTEFLLDEFDRRRIVPSIGRFGARISEEDRPEFNQLLREQLAEFDAAQKRRQQEEDARQLQELLTKQAEIKTFEGFVNDGRSFLTSIGVEFVDPDPNRPSQFETAGRTAAERTTEFSSESEIGKVNVTPGSGIVSGSDAPERLQAARDAEAAREAARIASARANNLRGMEQDFRDVDEFERQQRARLNEARLAGQDQPVLAPRPTDPRRISNTARVDEGFGFGTRGANALAEARERQQQERARLATLPPSARGIGETDLAAQQQVSSQRPPAAATPPTQRPLVLPPSARGIGATDLVAEVAAETEVARARQAEARASATRQATQAAAAQAEAEVEASREAVRNAPTAREAVDRMDASRDADARAARLRESAEIAAEEEKMLRETRQRAQRLANQALAERRRREAGGLAAAQEAARTEERRRNALALAAANTREVSSTSPFAS